MYRVGPDENFRRPSELVNRVVSGDVIEIMPGTYLNDEAVWRADDLTIRGVGWRPHLHFDKQHRISNRKAIWVIAGDNIRLENIEFSGAHVPNLNGAGLRVEGANLSVGNCFFHHNEFGILTGRLEGTLTISNSEFAYQHRNGTFAHGIYVGDVERFVFQGNYVHHSDGGHHVKSRARKSVIRYNFLSDGKDGEASYAIDLPNCGDALVMGNVLLQGERSVNHTAIAYGSEGCAGKTVTLSVVNNSFVNRYPNGGFFVKNRTERAVLIANNMIVGNAGLVSGKARNVSNISPGLRGISESNIMQRLLHYDTPAGTTLPAPLMPTFQYRHPTSVVPRPVRDKIAIGAFQAEHSAR